MIFFQRKQLIKCALCTVLGLLFTTIVCSLFCSFLSINLIIIFYILYANHKFTKLLIAFWLKLLLFIVNSASNGGQCAKDHHLYQFYPRCKYCVFMILYLYLPIQLLMWYVWLWFVFFFCYFLFYRHLYLWSVPSLFQQCPLCPDALPTPRNGTHRQKEKVVMPWQGLKIALMQKTLYTIVFSMKKQQC